ncbi:MAG: FMN-binding protein [Solirubrobacteraceae bacterium]|nr:FMN-binding protein [Solirubrobacteraceae bacterium]
MLLVTTALVAGCGSSTSDTTASQRTSTSTASTPAGTQTITGATVPDRFGDNTVSLVVKGKKIVDVHSTLPTDRPRSAEINAQAGPLLRTEVLQAQGAGINVISGATYTSEAFIQSLTAAVAHLPQ